MHIFNDARKESLFWLAPRNSEFQKQYYHFTYFREMSEITKKEIDCIKGNILAEDRFTFCFSFSVIYCIYQRKYFVYQNKYFIYQRANFIYRRQYFIYQRKYFGKRHFVSLFLSAPAMIINSMKFKVNSYLTQDCSVNSGWLKSTLY